MASNSFFLKGWAVTLVVGVLAFANVKDMDEKYIVIALIPTLIFWFLDGFYLHQEKLFRVLYDEIRKEQIDNEINFSMDTKPFINAVDSWFKVCVSTTLRMFYIPIIIVIILATWILPLLN